MLRSYVERSPVVAIGGLVHGPCPRAVRHLYLAEIARAFPGTGLWALGQLVGDVNNWSCHELPSTSVSHRRHYRVRSVSMRLVFTRANRCAGMRSCVRGRTREAPCRHSRDLGCAPYSDLPR
jgi:hypothetical protein